MKKIILSALLCICTVALYAQTCSPAGYSQFDMSKSALRTGLFSAPNDSPDSIGCYAAAFGYQTKPKGYASFAIGNFASTTGDYSFAGGSYSIASGQNATSLGFQTSATSNEAFSIGSLSRASGPVSLATGRSTIASNFASTAMGYYTTASGYASTSIGLSTQATNEASFAGGINSIASGMHSYAFGINALAPGYESTSMGSNTISGGTGSHTLGYYSQSSGSYSFAIGTYAESRAPNSFSIGNGTITKAIDATAIGSYNDSTDNPNPFVYGSTDRVFQVGIGGPQNRYNALTVLRNGNMGIGVLSPAQKLDVAGNIAASGNITVQNKGIIRSVDGTQQKKLVANVTVNTTFTAGQTKTFSVTWPESFSAPPDGFIGSLVSGAGGWAEVVMTLATTTTTGVTLYVYNPKTTSVSPNFTIKVIAIGAQ